MYELHEADALEWLHRLDDCSVDLVVTDIAYESMDKHRKIGTTTRLSMSQGSSNNWFPTFPNTRIPELFEELYRVQKKNTHLYFFTDVETMLHVIPIGQKYGYTFHKPIIWHKLNIGMGYHYRNTYECILFFEKGKRKLNDAGIPDILMYKSLRKKGLYPTQKPKELIDILVLQSSNPGNLVIDPFMGSGVVGESAVSLTRDFKGCDILHSSYSYAKSLLSKFDV